MWIGGDMKDRGRRLEAELQGREPCSRNREVDGGTSGM